MYTILITIISIAGYIISYIKQDIKLIPYSIAIAFIVTSIICIPDYPFYNRHKLKWQAVRQNRAVNAVSGDTIDNKDD